MKIRIIATESLKRGDCCDEAIIAAGAQKEEFIPGKSTGVVGPLRRQTAGT